MCVCVCVCMQECVGVVSVCVCVCGNRLNLAWFAMPSWQIKNIADRSKNFHTHLFLFTARNLHIKAEQKDGPCCVVLCCVLLRCSVWKGSQISDFDTSENIEKLCVAINAAHGDADADANGNGDGVDVDGIVNI